MRDGSPVCSSLKNILVAFSWHNPAVGYVQGLNILAAFALLYLEEEEAFWLLVTLVEDLIGKEWVAGGGLLAVACSLWRDK